MIKKPNPQLLAQFAAILAIAAALKTYYANASVNDLRWILAPTACLVEVITGETFRFESYAGYMSGDQSFLIAAPCAGLNFLITAFLMLAIVRLWKNRTTGLKWRIIPAAFAAAYLTTILANTIRIAIALRLHRMGRPMIWVNPEQMHRFEGIAVYFGFLLLLFVVNECLEEPGVQQPRKRFFLLRLTLLPLAIYWVTTLAIPLVNGASRKGTSFWEHSIFVLLTPLILILPPAIIGFFRGRSCRRESSECIHRVAMT